MDESFDRYLIKKIKSALQDRAEPYEEGSWEKFLAKKSNKKKTVFLWYTSGIAASLLVALSAGVWFIQKEGTPLHQPGHIAKEDHYPGTAQSPKDSLLSNKGRGSTNDTPLAGEGEPVTDRYTGKRAAPIHNVAETMAAEEKIPDSAELSMPSDSLFNSRLMVAAPAGPIHISDSSKVSLSGEYREEETSASEKKSSLEVGLFFSPGFGVSQGDVQTVNSSNFGGGVSIEMPVSTRFSLGSGLAVNSLNITNEVVQANQRNAGNQVDKTEISQVNVDIPLNIKYSIPNRKENLYVMAGVSSYYSLRQHSDLTSTITREVEIVRESGGETEVITVTETVTDRRSSPAKANQFTPAAMVNIMFGFRAYTSRHALYEIQPYYKHPVRPLVNEDVKFAMGGVTFKITFINITK